MWPTVLAAEDVYPNFCLTMVQIPLLVQPRKTRTFLPGNTITWVSSTLRTLFTGQWSQPAQFLLVYLFLYLGIWISFAQAYLTWQLQPNPNGTHTVNCPSASFFSSCAFKCHLCILRSKDCNSSYALCIFRWGTFSEIISLIIERGWEERACQVSRITAF